MIMGHAALTDVETGEHLFSELLYRAAPVLGSFGSYPDSVIARSAAPAGTREGWSIVWNGRGFDLAMRDRARGFGFELATTSARPPVMQGPNGFSAKGSPGSASQYYSLTRLATSGVVTLGDDTLEVAGKSWMDKEFGSNQLAQTQTGWDWFAIQLEDGRDLMLYRIRGEPTHSQATVTRPDGATEYLSADRWSATPSRTWTSPATGAEYPVRWSVAIPSESLTLTIRPVVDDQENVSRLLPELYYWEGAVEILDADGSAIGRGYIELTGYGDGTRPAL
jgi:predicted secreted hydrolase